MGIRVLDTLLSQLCHCGLGVCGDETGCVRLVKTVNADEQYVANFDRPALAVIITIDRVRINGLSRSCSVVAVHRITSVRTASIEQRQRKQREIPSNRHETSSLYELVRSDVA